MRRLFTDVRDLWGRVARIPGMEARKTIVRAALAGALAAGVAVVVAGALAPAGAKESYLGGAGAPGGVTVSGSPYRYVAIAPRTRSPLTVVERIDRAGGRVDRWWYLRGSWAIPAGSFSRQGTGLAGGEGTLVLAGAGEGQYRRWPPLTRLAVLDTQVRLRSQQRPDGVKMSHAIRYVALHGRFEVAAVSPNGSTAYLTEALRPHRWGTPPRRGEGGFDVRALDLLDGRLDPAPLRTAAGRRVALDGTAIDRVASRDGRWSYGLYIDESSRIFVLGIDTVAGTVARTALPLDHLRNPFWLTLRLSEDGSELIVARRRGKPQLHPVPPLSVPLPLTAAATEAGS